MTEETFPPLFQMKQSFRVTPDFMRPVELPLFIFEEAVLSNDECDSIVEEMMKLESYSFPSCGATETRECVPPIPPVLSPITNFINKMNDKWWKFVVDDQPASWLQTYRTGDSYSIHMDAAIGQVRKLTAVALMTDPSEYEGGELEIIMPPYSSTVPKTRGTICVFPGWTYHKVHKIESGYRQTINLGLWGPPFK